MQRREIPVNKMLGMKNVGTGTQNLELCREKSN